MSLSSLLNFHSDINWAVDKLIPDNALCILGGMQGLGKTWLLLDLAIELSQTGIQSKWLDKFYTSSRKVLYIDEESSPQLLKTRLSKLISAKNIKAEDLSISFVVGANFDLLQPTSVQKLEQIIETEEPRVIIVDSLVRVHSAEENSSTAMAEFFGVIKNLIRKYNVTFIFADHEHKGVYSADKRDMLPTSNDLRGSNEKGAVADSVLSLRLTKDGLMLFHTKSRFTEASLPLLIKIIDEGAHSTKVVAF
jgi:RecA-family ATPase